MASQGSYAEELAGRASSVFVFDDKMNGPIGSGVFMHPWATTKFDESVVFQTFQGQGSSQAIYIWMLVGLMTESKVFNLTHSFQSNCSGGSVCSSSASTPR